MDSLFGKSKRKPGGVLVLYTTRHGATQRYAERIAAPLDALVKDAAYARIADAKTYDAIVVGCCVYAGKLKGLDFLEQHAGELADKRLVVFTCGLNDPAQEDVRAGLDAQIDKALGGTQASVFHLRGALRWKSLGLLERVMMSALASQIRRKPEAERSEADRQFLEAAGGAIDFSDEAELEPIIRAARGGEATV
ncbi:MAG: flavodoxin domain-containing protein [Candidatus Ventricola sp.]